MRILIGCDERSSPEKLYYDLKRAGIPGSTEVYVLSVADVFVPPGYKTAESERPRNKAYLTRVDREIKKANDRAVYMSQKLSPQFPLWDFRAGSAGGSPVMKILNKAQEWKADLIVVGSHGRSRVEKFFLGSVALKVLSESFCSVRIVRAGAAEDDSPTRIVIGVDGSAESDAAIHLLATRHWRQGSSAHLITAIDTVLSTVLFGDDLSVGQMTPITIPDDSFIKEEWRTQGDEETTVWVKKMHEEYKSKLQKAGLIVSSFIKDGDPKVILVKEARRWGAECIFVGAAGHGRMERFLLGSVSAAIAARAHCSVEVIRNPKAGNNFSKNHPLL